ncbi:CgeB family protein [Thermoflexus sp.]|uniref:CgeB family protein n=1 Tax=Thermoflexus sp. TaxID=1969742 RepID=UPI002ADE7D64|nr:glycosyltransferase [Thermoflexus sp.]
MRVALGYRWFPTAAGYHMERALQALGHEVIYVGLPCAQRAGYDTTVPVDALIAALPQKPDLYLWIDPAGRYFPPGIERLPIPTACYLIDVHLGRWREQAARFFDAVFIAQKDYLERFRRAMGHDQVYWLPLAAAPDVHYDHQLPRIYEVGFVGNIAQAHRRTARARRLKRIAERFHTNDFYRTYMPEEVGRIYSQSRIVFNCSIAGDVTMRIFEGTACGALVLTDAIANGLDELFEIGREIVVYQDDEDLLGKIAYYLTHDEEREAIARAGQRRTLREHTYLHRMQKLIEIVSAPGFRRLAPMRAASEEERWRARREVFIHLHMLDALLDQARDLGFSPLRRAWSAFPCLVRRLIL